MRPAVAGSQHEGKEKSNFLGSGFSHTPNNNVGGLNGSSGRGIAARRTQVHSDGINCNVKLCCPVIEASRGTHVAVNLDFQNIRKKKIRITSKKKSNAREIKLI